MTRVALRVLIASLMARHHYPTPIERVSANHYAIESSIIETNDCIMATNGVRARIETDTRRSKNPQWWLVFVDSSDEIEDTCEINIKKETK
jgi:hypothetical protein